MTEEEKKEFERLRKKEADREKAEKEANEREQRGMIMSFVKDNWFLGLLAIASRHGRLLGQVRKTLARALDPPSTPAREIMQRLQRLLHVDNMHLPQRA